MSTFPPGKLTVNGFKRQRISSVNRSDMESGPAKQALLTSTSYIRFPVTYLFTKAEYDAFDAWAVDTIKFVGAFDWTDPVTGVTHIDTRIVNGDISDAAPINPHMANWLVGLVLEVSS